MRRLEAAAALEAPDHTRQNADSTRAISEEVMLGIPDLIGAPQKSPDYIVSSVLSILHDSADMKVVS